MRGSMPSSDVCEAGRQIKEVPEVVFCRLLPVVVGWRWLSLIVMRLGTTAMISLIVYNWRNSFVLSYLFVTGGCRVDLPVILC